MHDVIIAALSPLISEIVGVAITALVGYAVKLLRDKTGIELDAKAQRDIHLALDSGAQVALAKLGIGASPDALKSEALAYAKQSVPDAIKRLKPTDGVLADLASAKVQAVIGGM